MASRPPTRRLFVLLRLVAVAALLSTPGELLPSTAHAGASPPSISLTSPSAGSTVKGTITVTATATAGSGDTLSDIIFYDGVNDIGSSSCGAQPSCSASIQWDATGLSGQHSLSAEADTDAGLSSRSTSVSITIVSPGPAVAITHPSAGATVVGSTTVTVSGATDPSQTDYPTSITIYDGVNDIGYITCQGQQTCQGSFTWDATGLSGQHRLTATISTNQGDSATSSGVTVKVKTPAPVVRIVSPHTGARLRHKMTIHVRGKTNRRLTDYPTSIAVFDGQDEIGQVSCQGQLTCKGSIKWDTVGLHGRQTLHATIFTNQGVSAASRRVRVGGTAKRPVSAVCKLSTTTAHLHQAVRGHCTLKGVLPGTAITILYRSRGHLYTAVASHVRVASRFNFTLRASRRRRFNLLVHISATAHTRSFTGHIGTLTVH